MRGWIIASSGDDAVNNCYWNLSRIPDEAIRVGMYPWRVEAESIELTGFKPYRVHPSEMESGSVAVVTSSNA